MTRNRAVFFCNGRCAPEGLFIEDNYNPSANVCFRERIAELANTSDFLKENHDFCVIFYICFETHQSITQKLRETIENLEKIAENWEKTLKIDKIIKKKKRKSELHIEHLKLYDLLNKCCIKISNEIIFRNCFTYYTTIIVNNCDCYCAVH